jgi:hypothetical protein
MTTKEQPAFDSMADPDWDSPLTFRLTPELIAHAVMETASAVHTGWQSCIDETAVLSELVAMDDSGEKAVRLVEQEFVDEQEQEQEQEQDVAWHDWSVEVRAGGVLIIGHWQVRSNSAPLDWEWAAAAAERAFERACVLLGRRVRRGLMVEAPMPRDLPPRSSRH